jgi:hypothetical protein
LGIRGTVQALGHALQYPALQLQNNILSDAGSFNAIMASSTNGGGKH